MAKGVEVASSRARRFLRSWRVNFYSKGRATSWVMGLEAEDPGFGRLEGGTVVGRPGLSLEDGEVDLDLVEPAGVDGQVDQAQVGPAALEPLD